MKVLTVKQPYASLIAEGIKEYEFRTWKTNYRGLLLIHAGKTIDKEALKKYSHLSCEYPTECIIAKVKLVDCIPIEDKIRKKLEEKNPFVYEHVINDKNFKGYGWKLEEVEKIDSIKIKGKLGLWNYEDENG